ncbi:hypothetical protein C8Q75DRAFT_867513 [Abortiporus biennis]|nr:hypothetical protein C8Q75DRAFT_867513 [Abortiporus biennis]
MIMKFVPFAVLAVPAFVAAHGNDHARLYARQATSSAPAATGTPPATVSFSLPTTNPTAVPLASITSGTPVLPPLSVTTTYAAGAQPTFLSNAPPLPDLSKVLPANYPALDKVPPTDSPQVQQWIQDVANSGITIPNITATVAGGCPANPQAAADTSRCWWTCGGCTRDDDITTCPDKLHWGLTHDDGPSPFTPNLLAYLQQANLHTTFFVVGSRAISYPTLLVEEYMAQHQLGVHTWSHPDLTTLTNEQIIAEFGWTKKVIKDITGVTPTHFRPPFGDVDDRVRAIAKAMNLETVIWTRISPTATFDTGDFNVAGGTTSPSQVLANWEQIMGNATTISTGFIVLEHDLFQQTVELATGYILPAALANNPALTIQPVITCLHKDFGDAYIETNNNSTNPLPVTASGSGSSGSSQSASGTNSGSGAQATGGSGKSSAARVSVDNLLSGVVTGGVAIVAGLSALL